MSNSVIIKVDGLLNKLDSCKTTDEKASWLKEVNDYLMLGTKNLSVAINMLNELRTEHQETIDRTITYMRKNGWEVPNTPTISGNKPANQPLDSLLNDFPNVRVISDPEEMSNKGTRTDYAYIEFGKKGDKDFKLFIFDTSEIDKEDPSGQKYFDFLIAIKTLVPDSGTTSGGISKERSLDRTANLEFKNGGFVEIK